MHAVRMESLLKQRLLGPATRGSDSEVVGSGQRPPPLLMSWSAVHTWSSKVLGPFIQLSPGRFPLNRSFSALVLTTIGAG